MSTESTKKLTLSAVIGVLLTVIPMLTTSLLTVWAISQEEVLRAWPLQNWLLATLFLTLTSAIALTPPTFLALVYGYFLGWLALPLLICLNLGAITIVFVLSKLLKADTVRTYLVQIYPKSAGLLSRFHQNELKLIFFAKLSPVLPFAAANLFFSMAGARLSQLILGGTLGMIPRTIIAVWIGKEAQNITYLLEHPNEGLWTKLFVILLIIVSTFGITYFLRERKVVSE